MSYIGSDFTNLHFFFLQNDAKLYSEGKFNTITDRMSLFSYIWNNSMLKIVLIMITDWQSTSYFLLPLCLSCKCVI